MIRGDASSSATRSLYRVLKQRPVLSLLRFDEL
jgi:hypothetical protein